MSNKIVFYLKTSGKHIVLTDKDSGNTSQLSRKITEFIKSPNIGKFETDSDILIIKADQIASVHILKDNNSKTNITPVVKNNKNVSTKVDKFFETSNEDKVVTESVQSIIMEEESDVAESSIEIEKQLSTSFEEIEDISELISEFGVKEENTDAVDSVSTNNMSDIINYLD